MSRRHAVIGVGCALLALGAASLSAAAPTAGRIVEYQIPSPGVPEGIAAAADGTLWFAERYTDQIGRMTPRGQFHIYSLSSLSNMPTDVTAGPDGALWFTFPNNVPPMDTGKIGRMTMAGDVSLYEIPWVSDAEAITPGPDGNLWFADHVAAAIGRVTPAGVMKKFAIPGPSGAYPYKIAAGSDGALWFTDLNARRIGRLTTVGQTRFFPIPAGHGYPDAITAGPDGNLWFTLDDTGRIARITTGGSITEYQLNQPSDDYVFLSGITTGPDGALWFTYHDYTAQTSKIGRITTGGSFRLFATPTRNSAPHGITSDPARRVLWFTEAASGNIGRISAR